MDFVRGILLEVETLNKPKMAEFLDADSTESDLKKLGYHLAMLVEEVGYLKGMPVPLLGGKIWHDLELTWQGHDFLDSVRDDNVWELTKKSAESAGGFTVEILAALAKGFVKQKIEKHTGIPIEI
ncbi:hypothetical protein BN1012_Phect2409 [Candidatus Phaeomarinobacter ectocarpi]|uniref:DUF2513 domain-containing protein n=2 Tax=Candidatus Phaeomarinibacter ectocarpi TaxID=1458461 RepID=X5ME08_9HYPH|nr:hypothetical protein BN1012_Phect2409 [Candidatus Phaeomarinobacter ectocarpi]